MSKEAMKLALEALELVNLEFVCGNGSHHAKKDRHEWDEDCPITDRWKKAITALREALAEQPAQQEPPKAAELVDALISKYSDKLFDSVGPHDAAKFEEDCNHIKQALAEQPAQQKPFAFYFETYSYEGQKSTWFVACPCDGKLNGKPGIPLYTSPPAPVQQEPVSWGVDWGRAGDIPCVSIIKRLPGGGIEVVAVEYGPQRTWVGLTDERIESVRHMRDVQGYDGNWNYDPYMQGLYNGLEFALSLLEVREPQFKDAPETWLGDIKVKYKLSSETEAKLKEKNT
jgi:hypothetical protein